MSDLLPAGTTDAQAAPILEEIRVLLCMVNEKRAQLAKHGLTLAFVPYQDGQGYAKLGVQLYVTGKERLIT